MSAPIATTTQTTLPLAMTTPPLGAGGGTPSGIARLSQVKRREKSSQLQSNTPHSSNIACWGQLTIIHSSRISLPNPPRLQVVFCLQLRTFVSLADLKFA
jgi:hypothetical protein